MYDVIPRADERRSHDRREPLEEANAAAEERRADDRRATIGGVRPEQTHQRMVVFREQGGTPAFAAYSRKLASVVRCRVGEPASAGSRRAASSVLARGGEKAAIRSRTARREVRPSVTPSAF